MRDLIVLIVNWNVRDLLRTCLTSVYADLAASNLEAEVWVVDNASEDGSPEMVHTNFPQVRLLVSPQNLGFAGGNNLALREMAATDPPRHILLLNPDTELCPGALQTLKEFVDSRPRVGVAGAKLVYGDGSFQHAAFHFPGLWQILFDLYPLPARLYESRFNGRYPRAWYEHGDPFPIDHPLGAAMMVGWGAIREVGFLDEAFHMYCEEIDWCMRLKKSGWDIYCVPEAQIVHHAGRSTRQIREESFVNLWCSRRRLYKKHYGTVRNWLAKQLVCASLKRRAQSVQRWQRQGKLDEIEARSRIRAYRGALACFQ